MKTEILDLDDRFSAFLDTQTPDDYSSIYATIKGEEALDLDLLWKTWSALSEERKMGFLRNYDFPIEEKGEWE